MPEENADQMQEQTPVQQGAVSVTSKISLCRVDAFANAAIVTTAIAWCSFILFVLLGIMDSSNISFLGTAFDGICIPFFYIAMLSNLVSLFSGIIGLVRVIIKRKESTGIVRVVIAIILSLVLFAVVIPALHKAN